MTNKTTNKWIPVKKESPDKPGQYLVTVYDWTIDYKYVRLGNYYIGGYWESPMITAWMPLPDPY